MAKASKGFRGGTRKKLKSRLRSKFKPNTHLSEFRPKTRVVIKQNPQSQRGMPHPIFKGRTGTILSKQGDAYIVEVYDGKKRKQIVARPEHIAKL